MTGGLPKYTVEHHEAITEAVEGGGGSGGGSDTSDRGSSDGSPSSLCS